MTQSAEESGPAVPPAVDRDPVERLATEYLDRLRRGEPVSLSDYTQRYPELAEEIRELFPAMVLMEEFGSVGGEPAPSRRAGGEGAHPIPAQLGEYRILREVGRGGMGLVFEAVQETLGRHVALKVLPLHHWVTPMHLERFRREARAAAWLHHTNIVPVFGVGEHEGIHYFAMQFIQGQSLDAVLRELKRIRGGTEPGRNACDAADPDLTQSVALSLLTGRFGTRAVSAPPTEVDRGAGADRGAARGAPPAFGGSPPDLEEVGSGSIWHGVPGRSGPRPHSELAAQTVLEYFRSVARVGVQVAEALDYAHRSGILHRDIKPANLLLDTRGTVWVTDFGLAKLEGADDLTNAGDVVGTVNYMAPERFQGRADPRSDVYSLGMTLYQLLTLQPAFEDRDRVRLMARVRAESPPRPRKIDPRIPSDLETIVLRAIAKEPSDRYATAAELAEDLRRFLLNRPIRARRFRAWEHLWRWCRRNPGLACLASLALVLAAVIVVGSWIAGLRLAAAARKLHAAEHVAAARLKHSREMEAAAAENLRASLLAQAQAKRRSGLAGQHFGALEDLARAARIRPAIELRDEAIACLALADIRVAREWDGFPAGTTVVAFDSELATYVRSDQQGNLSVHRVEGDREIARFPGRGDPIWDVRFSADGRWLAAAGPQQLVVRELASGTVLLDVPAHITFDLSRDARRLAVLQNDRSILVYDLADRTHPRRLARQASTHTIRFHPSEPLLALSSLEIPDVEVYDFQTDRVVATLPHPAGVRGLAWRDDGRRLACACLRDVHVWNTEELDVAPFARQRILQGHQAEATYLTFNHAGNLLASTSWDGTLRIWDPESGRQLVQGLELNPIQPRPQFSRDDRYFAAAIDRPRIRLLEVTAGRGYQILYSDQEEGKGPWSVTFSPDGRLLAAGSDDGVRLWSQATLQPLIHLRLVATPSLFFAPDGEAGWPILVTGSRYGVQGWPIAESPSAGGARLRLGPPLEAGGSPALLGISSISQSRDGGLLATAGDHRIAVWPGLDRMRNANGAHPLWRGDHRGAARLAFSPDGRWLASGNWQGQDVRIWDARTGRLERIIAGLPNTCPLFSPDGRHLVTGSGTSYTFWEVGTWRRARELPRYVQEGLPGLMAFSPDGSMMALAHTIRRVRLLDPKTGEKFADLAAPVSEMLSDLTFSPDGALLAAATGGHLVQLWDLGTLHQRLTRLNLAWDRPADPPRPSFAGGPARDPGPPILAASTRSGHPAFFPSAGRSESPATLVRRLGELDRSLSRQPNDAGARASRARIHQQIAHRARLLGRSLQILSRLGAALVRPLASILSRAADHHFAQALSDLQAAQRLDPDEVLYSNNLAWLEVMGPESHRDPRAALAPALQARRARTREYTYANTLGTVYFRLGRDRDALRTLHRAIELNNHEATAYELFLLAMIHHRLGDPARARARYHEALAWWRSQPPLDWSILDELVWLWDEADRVLGLESSRTSGRP